jgi:hypothetical protein
MPPRLRGAIDDEQTRLVASWCRLLCDQLRRKVVIEIGRLHGRSVTRLLFDTKAICWLGGAWWGGRFLTIFNKNPQKRRNYPSFSVEKY